MLNYSSGPHSLESVIPSTGLRRSLDLLCRLKSSKMRLSIFSRLMLGYLAIFILVAGVSVYIISKLHQVNSETRRVLRINYLILDSKEKMTASILSQLQNGRKYVVTKDPLFYEQFLIAKELFNQAFSEVFLMADAPEKKDSMKRIEMAYRHYLSLLEEDIEKARLRFPYPRRAYEMEIKKTADTILEDLEKLQVYAQKDIRHRMKKWEDAGAKARTLAIFTSLITILLVISASLLITRSITRPFTLLMNKTKEISRGAFNSDLEISSPPEISEVARYFNAMCRQLNAVEKMKADFFSTMSHELRTPLASIKEGVSLLKDGIGGTSGDKQAKLLNILTMETNRLIGHVNSFLDLSKMEAGMMTYHFEQGSLHPLIKKAMMEMVPLVEAKKIKLEATLTEELPVIKMDDERILQALRNLIGNAVKFTPEGGRVRISARHGVQELEISVTDTGPGIPKEDIQTIFEKFHQVSVGHSERANGTGLGLAIVKYIITAHRGRVWVESEPGRGSTFSFALPA
jgi:two-component system sensor histidine kinase GlrK